MTFVAGMAAGIALIWLARVVINETTIPDRLLAPLMLEDSSATADAIVVLGAGVIGPCVPNLNALRRTLLGARLLKEGRAPLIVFTGGRSREHCPVADAMAQVARELGIPQEKMILERQSISTLTNAERTAPLLRERNVQRILLVTDRLHMRRADGVFRRLGFTVQHAAVPVYESHIDNVSMFSTGIREAAALAYYRFRGWAAPLDGTGDQPRAAHHADAPTGTAGSHGRNESGAIVEPQSMQKAAGADNRPLVILGASYAAGWKLPALGGTPVHNKGVAGQQSLEMLARFERDVVAARPRAVLLWGFINDVFRTNDPAQALARMRETYTEMSRRARAHGIEPIIATEVTMRPPKGLMSTLKATIGPLLGKTSYQDQINAHVMQGNRWLREFAQREGLLLLDLEQALADGDGRRRHAFATDDGSHISPEGYEALTTYAQPILAHRLRPTASGRTVEP